MSDDKNLGTFPAPTPEELKQEEEALKEAKEDEIQAQVISEFGFDAEVDADAIAKIIKERLDHKKALSTVISQKIKRRNEVAELLKKFALKDDSKKDDEKKGLTPEELDARLDERDRQRDLDALEASDVLKKEIESFAKLQKISVKKALDSDYIQFLKKKEDDKRIEEEASAGASSGTRPVKDRNNITQPRKAFDLSDEEGRKSYEAWKKVPGNLEKIPLE